MNQPLSPQYLVLGEVLRPHGVRGELRMRIWTNYPERIATLEIVYLGKNPAPKGADAYQVQHLRIHQGHGLLKLVEISNRNQAELLRGSYVMVSMQDAIPLDNDEVYLYQLIGLRVQTENHVELGRVADVLETGANDVYIVRSEVYGEILLPVTEETILDTDIENGVITVSLLDGLLPQWG